MHLSLLTCLCVILMPFALDLVNDTLMAMASKTLQLEVSHPKSDGANQSHMPDIQKMQTQFPNDWIIKSFVRNYVTSILHTWEPFHVSEHNQSFQLKYIDKVITFRAYDKNFTMALQEYQRVVSPRLNVYIGKNVWTGSDFSTSVYTGAIVGIPGSYVYGKVDGNTFDGTIQMGNETLFIEPLSKYQAQNGSVDICIVYKKSDIINKVHFKKIRNSDNCYSTNIEHFSTPLTRTISKIPRTKRQTVLSHSCTLHVIADHTFYQTIGQSSRSQTIAEIVFLVGNADHIFRSTDFNGDGQGDNLGFIITAITIFPNVSTSDYKLSSTNMNVYEYLNTFSTYNFDDYCLGISFTYRDFQEGVVGLAWIGNSDIYGPPGGICQDRVRLFSDGNLYNYNTALVSLLNYQSRIPTYKASLTLAHEFGHSFGSHHDDANISVCAPENEFGNFIMFPYTGDGSKPNNNKFSSCSISAMYPVILNKGHCLVVDTGPVCGNGIKEADEECDCGSSSMCQLIGDICCVPSDVTNEIDRPCSFRRQHGKMCSWMFSPCCDMNCGFSLAEDGHKCSEATQCKHAAFCNGSSGDCPDGIAVPDGTPCDGGKKACRSGLCTESVCESRSMLSCQCSQDEEMCMLCCSVNSTGCQPSSSFGIYGTFGEILYEDAGATCNDNKGICNDERACITKNPENIIKRLEEVFDETSMEDIKTWLENYWYYILLAVVGVAVLIFIFVVTKKKMDNTHITAYRIGRYMRVVDEANLEKERQRRQFLAIDAKYNEKIRRVNVGSEPKEFANAVSRLVNLFPTVPTATISEVCRKCTSEDVAVRLLLVKGYPIRRLVTSRGMEDSDG